MSGQVRAHIQLSRGDDVLGKLVIELYSNVYPHTVRAFVGLMQLHLLPEHARAMQEQSTGSKLPPPLHGSKITRINAGESVEFGTSATNSFLGGMFPNEPRADVLEREERMAAAGSPNSGDVMEGLEEISHKFGTLSMSNVGPNTNASNYFLCLIDESNAKNAGTIRALNNNHTVFGIIRNEASLQLLKDIGTQVKVNRQNVPVEPIKLSEMAVEQVAPSGFGAEGRKLTKKEAKMQRLKDKEAARQARLEGLGDTNKRSIFARAVDDQPDEGDGETDNLAPQRTIEDDEARPNKRRRFEPAGPAARPMKGILSPSDQQQSSSSFAARGPVPQRSTLAGTGVTPETAAPRGARGSFDLFSAQSTTFNSDIKELSANQRAKRKRKMSKY